MIFKIYLLSSEIQLYFGIIHLVWYSKEVVLLNKAFKRNYEYYCIKTKLHIIQLFKKTEIY